MSPGWSNSILNVLRTYGGVNVRLETNPHLVFPKHCIVLANHQNYVDILALFVLLKHLPLRFVGKNTLRFGFPGVTNVMRFARHVFVNQRDDPMGAVQAVRRFAARIYREGLCPVIFPEGTRSQNGTLGTFRTGGLRTITEIAHLPYVAIAVDGGHTINSAASLTKAKRPYYYAKPVLVHAPVNGKAETAAMLTAAHEAIALQISVWRGERS
jgi:1-acyl-sn-glycerol-3-phosphate acyltransferase